MAGISFPIEGGSKPMIGITNGATSRMSFVERIWGMQTLFREVKARGGKWQPEDRVRERKLRELTQEDVQSIIDRGITPFEMRHLGKFHVAKQAGQRIAPNLREAIYYTMAQTRHPRFESFKLETRCFFARKPHPSHPTKRRSPAQ